MIQSTFGGHTYDYYYNENYQVVQIDFDGGIYQQIVWDPTQAATPLELTIFDSSMGTVIDSYFYMRDLNGNVTGLIDGSGTVVERYAYSDYGNVTVFDGSWTAVAGNLSAFGNPLLFQAMMFDAPTGLYRTLNRFYSPENQTWITRDPIGYEGGANVYAFVSGNPISATDPLGLEPRSALALPAGGATSIAARWGAEPGRFERIKEVLMGLFPDVDMPTIQRLTERVVNGGVNKITESVNTFVSNPVVQQVAANPVVQGVAQQTIQNSDKVPAAQEVANKVGNKVIESFQSNSNAGEGAAHSGQEGVNKVTNGTGGQLPDPGKGPNWIQKALEAKDVANRRCADDLANIMKQLQDAGRTKVYKVEFTPKVGRFLDAKDLAGNSINQHIANPSMPGWGNHLATYDPETGLIYDMITGGNGMKYADYMTKVFGANWKEFVLVNGK